MSTFLRAATACLCSLVLWSCGEDPSPADMTEPGRCGDGLAGGSEACDDGNDNDTDSCRNDCSVARCGDGVVLAGTEACDDGNQIGNDGCRNDCALPRCGDGIQQAGEGCDDGNQIDTDICRNSCMLATCGDGARQSNELCDDGNGNDTDECRNTCVPAACGDGALQAGVEICDDGNQVDTDACLNTCVSAICGDSVVQSGVEGCDDGNQVDTDACLNTCVTAICGDSVIQAAVEGCDDGNQDDTDNCRNNCAAAICGDGAVQAGVDACDDGNLDNTDTCLNGCVVATCGDGAVHTGVEACDDGNLVNDDGCSSRCDIERCGDGLVQFSRGETCDDGNLIGSDGCDATCKLEPFTTTAPVLISGALDCTTATANAARKVAVDSSGTIFAVMQCQGSAQAVTSSNRGVTFSAPVDLSAGLPNAPVTVSQVAISTGTAKTAYAAILLSTGEVYLRITNDGGLTWGDAALVGRATSTASGLSLNSFNEDLYIGFASANGVSVASNHTSGVGAFTTTLVSISIAFFDLVFDVRLGTLAVVADTPGFHVRQSTDQGVTFAAEVNPAGQQYYSDWAIGNGSIFAVGTNLGASGDANKMYIIPSSSPTTSTSVAGLPAVTSAQTRTVAADSSGNAYIASQLDAGGVQLDRLVFGAATFSPARLIDAAGASPIVSALPAGAGVAMVYTKGTQVFATMQAY